MPGKRSSPNAGGRGRHVVRRVHREGPETPLTREHIVSSALALVDRDGLDALSMRGLGAELGVDPMAPYYYIPNKEALLNAIVEAVMSEIDLAGDDPAAAAEERIMHAARAYRDALLAHRNALPILLARRPITPGAMRPVELLIGILRAAGLPPGQAMAGMHAIAAAVRGIAGIADFGDVKHRNSKQVRTMLQDASPSQFPHLREAIRYTGDFLERDFEFGIRALARGLIAKARHARKRSPSRPLTKHRASTSSRMTGHGQDS